MRRPIDEARELARAEHRIKLAIHQHLVQGLAGRYGLQVDIAGEPQRRAFVAPRLLLPSGSPLDVRWIEPVLLLEDTAHPDVCCLLVLGQSDQLSLEIGRAADVPVGPDVDRGVAEMA